MKALLITLVLAEPLHAQSAYDASRVALYTGVTVDAVSTEMAIRRGNSEANPIVGNSPWQRYPVTIGTVVATDWLTSRLRAKGHGRTATILNFTLGSFRWGVAVRNTRI